MFFKHCLHSACKTFLLSDGDIKKYVVLLCKVTMNEEIIQPESYIASSIEKKRAIAALFFMGIVIMLAKQQELSVFERYYLSLSLSLWTL